MMQFNTQALAIGGLVVMTAAAIGAPYIFSDVRQAFGAGWIAFGLLLLLCSPKHRRP